MSWLLFALLSSFFYAISSLTDKLFIDRLLRNVSAFSIVVLSAIAGIPFLIAMFLFSDYVPDLRTFVFGFTAGWLVLAGTYFYYSSLRKADPAIIMATFQLVLPFNYLFGVLFLNEILSVTQIIGALVVVGGSLIVSFEENDGSWNIKKKALGMMAIASLLVSMSDVVFKLGSKESDFLSLAITEYLGTVLAGLILFVASKKVHKELGNLFNLQKAKVLAITQINEGIYVTATFLFRYAIILGPIALVQVAIGTSPIIVMFLGWILGIFIPKLSFEKRKRKDFYMQLSGMFLSCVGILLLSM